MNIPYAEYVTSRPLPTYPKLLGLVETVEPMELRGGRWLALWSGLWRYGITALTGFFFLLVLLAEFWSGYGSASASNAVVGFFLLDVAFGCASLCLLPLRRRFPITIALVTAAFSAVSASSLASAIWAAISMSTQRRWKGVIAVGAVWAAATIYYEGVLRPSAAGMELYLAPWTSGGLVLATYAICVATGFYVGARRALLSSLRERADNAEHEQAMRAESAREAERTRIAREMHDVLAHRISLIALHAGAMTYRADLSREETAVAARVIQDNAHLALTELRQVLGVLRGGQSLSEAGQPEPAQPTLADLPALLADAREAGMTVSLDAASSEGVLLTQPNEPTLDVIGEHPQCEPSKTVSRTAYRIVQEGLTNARKHVPGAPIHLRLLQSEGVMQVEVRNTVLSPNLAAGVRGTGAHRVDVGVVQSNGSGVGLIGLRERAELAGGRLEHGIDRDGIFLLKAWLPWT